ncbi:substrate-binding periplasmic protein [Desulfurivibrio alkaliphilus]|uniref:Extracellular solute-binding protein family 3 n=1 Tax=Desulfurivibrio alkaliphilus (strain DSM 19089 / UNIQEM U267 / AHT2) TaxID=589865 RepID=D6Z5L5_DESAT|nr:transporter substrate-binding domain-containing protein [Desulfurivibrio alkaliphilus]ADH86752.1 extracellular solute-binding protein family 3 [Desulfurivibrio alkaliphilus AHT 2]
MFKTVVVILFLVSPILCHQPVAAEPLRVGIHSGNRTLEFVTNNGDPAGILVDLWREWAQHSGMELEFVAVEPSKGTTLLGKGKIDVLANAPPGKDVDYTPAYLTFDYSLHALMSFHPETPGHFPARIGIRTDDLLYIDPTKLNNLQVQQYSDHVEIFKALENGHIDYLLANSSQLILAINNMRLRKLHFPRKSFYQQPIRAAVQKNQAQLLNEITTGLATIDSARKARSLKRWMPSTIGYRIFWPFIGLAFFMVLSTILVITVWLMNQRLKQHVWRATRAMSAYSSDSGHPFR